MSDLKLPVFSTVGLSLRWTLEVVKRHWILVAVYVLGTLAILALPVLALPQIEMGRPIDPARVWPLFLLFLLWPLYGAFLTILAIVTHNEVLRGAGGLDSATLGRGGSRVFGYILDIVILMFVFYLLVLLVLGLVVNLVAIVVSGGKPGLPIVFGMLGAWLASVLLVTRMSLRLPGRAIGQALPWADVWALGRGNTWRLIGGLFLLLLVISVATTVLSAPAQIAVMNEVMQGVMKMDPRLPQHVLQGQAMLNVIQTPTSVSLFAAIWIGLVIAVSGPATMIILGAFLSVVYATLRQREPTDRGGPAF